MRELHARNNGRTPGANNAPTSSARLGRAVSRTNHVLDFKKSHTGFQKIANEMSAYVMCAGSRSTSHSLFLVPATKIREIPDVRYRRLSGFPDQDYPLFPLMTARKQAPFHSVQKTDMHVLRSDRQPSARATWPGPLNPGWTQGAGDSLPVREEDNPGMQGTRFRHVRKTMLRGQTSFPAAGLAPEPRAERLPRLARRFPGAARLVSARFWNQRGDECVHHAHQGQISAVAGMPDP